MRLLKNLLWGLGAVDAVLIGGLYVIGAYIIVDMPVNAAMFFGALYAFSTPERRGLALKALFATLVLLIILCLTSAAVPLVPRYTDVDLNVRMLHAVAGRFFLLGFLPYLVQHLRTRWPDTTPRWQRIATLAGWGALKWSLWLGAFMALAVIKGGLVRPHVLLLAVSLPLIVMHIVWSLRAGSAASTVRPFRLASEFSAARLGWATLVALIVSALFVSLFPQHKGNWNLVATPEERALPGPADLSPSPARLTEGHYIGGQFLGQSAGCGVDPCHPLALPQWRESAHRRSVTPRYRSELGLFVRSQGVRAGRLCAGCHDPISLYSNEVNFGKDLISPDGAREGISCLVCHSVRATEAAPANGALEFRFPTFFGNIPAWTFSMVSYQREHALDFDGPAYREDRVCIACHRMRPLAGWTPTSAGSDWIAQPYHTQAGMLADCRGTQGCVACHMPGSPGEKPFSVLPNHAFRKGEARRPPGSLGQSRGGERP